MKVAIARVIEEVSSYGFLVLYGAVCLTAGMILAVVIMLRAAP